MRPLVPIILIYEARGDCPFRVYQGKIMDVLLTICIALAVELSLWLFVNFLNWFFKGKRIIEPDSPAFQVARRIHILPRPYQKLLLRGIECLAMAFLVFYSVMVCFWIMWYQPDLISVLLAMAVSVPPFLFLNALSEVVPRIAESAMQVVRDPASITKEDQNNMSQ